MHTRDLVGAITALLDGSIASLAGYRLRYILERILLLFNIDGLSSSFSRTFPSRGHARFLVHNERETMGVTRVYSQGIPLRISFRFFCRTYPLL